VEVLVALPSADSVKQVDRLLDMAFDPGTAAWVLDAEGAWTRRSTDQDGRPLADLQEWLVKGSRSRH
jgi:polyphosphate kinase